MSETGHGAAPSALGYAYQAEAALVELVRRAKVEPATKLTIERYDDVAFETDGSARELLRRSTTFAASGTSAIAAAISADAAGVGRQRPNRSWSHGPAGRPPTLRTTRLPPAE